MCSKHRMLLQYRALPALSCKSIHLYQMHIIAVEVMIMDLCVCCGQYVPEGTWVCDECRKKYELMIEKKKNSR